MHAKHAFVRGIAHRLSLGAAFLAFIICNASANAATPVAEYNQKYGASSDAVRVAQPEGVVSVLSKCDAKNSVWQNFQIIMWQDRTARQYEALRAMGVTAARVQANRQGETPASASRKAAPIVQAKLRPYIENIATDFYSAYHRWAPGKPPNWQFVGLQAAFARNPDDRDILVRQPSLTDIHALHVVEKRLTDTVKAYSRYHPLFFNLGDEPGIADLSAAWDFDFSASSLEAMRAWLRQQYGSLAALNEEWGTKFERWHDVTPPTTTVAMASPDENYAAWSDFKNWMDIAFARALEAGTKAIHNGAPWACSAIEGAQMPGWGGYDYTKLAHAVDVMELYDSGDNLRIVQSLNPQLVTLTSLDWREPNALHQAWREFLRGVRGMIIWDPNNQFVGTDGSPGPDGRRALPFLVAMHKGLGPLLLKSQPVSPPIAVLYSPASFRIQWMLDHRGAGDAWAMRGSEKENEDNAVRASRRRVLQLLMRFGLGPRFVSEQQIAEGALQQGGHKILFLPQTLALSRKSADAIRSFVDRGGTLVADGDIGLFDGHGRRLSHPLLADLLKSENARAVNLPKDNEKALHLLAKVLNDAHVEAVAKIVAPFNPRPLVEQYSYRNGPVTLIALLARPEAQKPRRILVKLSFPKNNYVYDIRARSFLGKRDSVAVFVGSDTPTVLALTDRPLSERSCKSILDLSACPMHLPAPTDTPANTKTR